MDFSHSEEFDEIRRMVREFAENEIRPHMMERDEAQTFPRDVLDRLGKLGLLGILIPTEYGGANLGYQEYVAIVEEPLESTGPSVFPLPPTIRCARDTSIWPVPRNSDENSSFPSRGEKSSVPGV